MSSRFSAITLASLLGVSDALLLPSCCAQPTRLPASRIASYQAAVCMCDAGEAAPEAAVAAAEPAAAEAAPKRGGKANKTPLDQLEVGAEVEGKIRSVMSYGAFVDIGAQTDALLHVSEISNEFIKDATEKLTAGDTIKGKIKAVNLEKQQLALTCKEPRPPRAQKPKVDLSKYESADPKEFVTGKVNSILDFGAFVTLEEGVDGLVHISQIQQGGVGKVEDVLAVGQEVKVRVVNVEKSKRRIGLSMLEWSENESKPRRGGGGGGFDVGFGEGDKEFHMNEEELAAIAVGEFTSSPFDAAFNRAEEVKAAKASKQRYERVVL